MIVNVFYLVFKCFIRAISNLTEAKPTPDLETFDMIHQNRFLLFSLVDLLNGLSVLYCFYCVADLSTNHKHSAKPVSLKRQSNLHKSSSTLNTLKLKQILRGTTGEERHSEEDLGALFQADNANLM